MVTMVYLARLGERCRYSSTFSGLIPVKYVGLQYCPLIRKPCETFTVLKDCGVFKVGDAVRGATFVTPDKCFVKTGMFTYRSRSHEWEQKEAN